MDGIIRNARTAAGALGALVMMSVPALAADIEGNWTTLSGETAAIAACGSSFCITLKTGAYAGKQIGKLAPDGNGYKGTIVDPVDDKEYSGNAEVNGAVLTLKGCALIVFCKTQEWHRQ